MQIISTVKSGETGAVEDLSQPMCDHHVLTQSQAIYEIAMRPWGQNVDGILLACTELPVIFPVSVWSGVSVKLFSSTDILAEAVIKDAYGGI